MVTLKFGRATSLVGFSSLKTSRFNNLPAARIVRELVQNSLDAAKEAGVTAIVRFRVEKTEGKDIPDLEGLARAFLNAETHHRKLNGGKLPEPAQGAVNGVKEGLQAINQGKAWMLSVTDNGIGLDVNRMNSLLGDGAGTKPDPATGAYGVGHLAPLALSDIRYMMYGGVTKEGQRTVSGWTILASHPGDQHLLDAEGFLVKGFNSGLEGDLYDFLDVSQHPVSIASCLDGIDQEWGHGTAIMVPVFNNFGSEEHSLWEIVGKVVSYNFCPAVYRGQLTIEVQDGDGTHLLNKESLDEILEEEQERTRRAGSNTFFRELRPSGLNAFSILKTLQTGTTQEILVGEDTAHISLLTPPPGGQTRLDLFRNGMWIFDDIPGLRRAQFANQQPFHATIEVNKEDGGELHRLVLKAEGPLHDNFSFSRLSKPEQADLRKAIGAIADWIREQVPEVGTEEYTVDDFLVVKNDNGGGGGARSGAQFSFWGLPQPMARRQSSQLIEGTLVVEIDDPPPHPPHPPSPPTPPPPPPPLPPVQTRARPLPFRAVALPDGEGKLTASLESEEDFAEAWLRIRADENTDVTCDRVWVDEDISIKSVSIKATGAGTSKPECDLMADKATVRLKGLSAKQTYELKVEYDSPPGLTATVGNPTLRLEMHRPTAPKQQPGNPPKEAKPSGS